MMLKIRNVRKCYNHFQLNCSLDVHKGYITGLIGQNGAGKTTLFKAILELVHIDDGSIEVFSEKSYDKNDIGVILSDSGFSEYLMIKDIIPILEHVYKKFDKKDFIEKCHMLALPLDKKIVDFSTGMKAKLKIIVALTHQAKLLILDEPTAGLDVIARDEILNLIREFMEKDEDRAVFISSHISSDLENLCDDIYMIDQGQIILHEEADNLLNQYALLKVDEQQYHNIDKNYIVKVKKEAYGYCCLTNQKQFYLENYPDIVIDKNNFDELFIMMIRGE